MKPVIAVPYFPGSNGDYDAINRIKEFDMTPLPLYFHIGDERRLEDNAAIIAKEADGIVLCGGFPYEDRIGFGTIPAKIPQFRQAIISAVQKGKPVIAFCAGNQIAHAMSLAFPNSTYKVAMLPNISDREGKLVTHGFLDKRVHTKLSCAPERTAFTRLYEDDEVLEQIMDHGGGRFTADANTLDYILTRGLVVERYADKEGNTINEYPVNPNGSMFNIESITNRYGNVKIGMCHNERKLNALQRSRANLVFASMREYIEDKCPDLGKHARSRDYSEPQKNFSYLSKQMNPSNVVDVYIKMLTDDNERTTAKIFLGADLERRRLLRLELAPQFMTVGGAQNVLQELAKMDFLDGIMLKKDLPTLHIPNEGNFTYSVTGKEGKSLVRSFVRQEELVRGFPVMHQEISTPNPLGYAVHQSLLRNPLLRDAVTNVHAGRAWFFEDERAKEKARRELLD